METKEKPVLSDGEIIEELIVCPLCQSYEIGVLGILGRLIWYRCQDCGIDFNIKPT